jgi:hypothetical protein
MSLARWSWPGGQVCLPQGGSRAEICCRGSSPRVFFDETRLEGVPRCEQRSGGQRQAAGHRFRVPPCSSRREGRGPRAGKRSGPGFEVHAFAGIHQRVITTLGRHRLQPSGAWHTCAAGIVAPALGPRHLDGHRGATDGLAPKPGDSGLRRPVSEACPACQLPGSHDLLWCPVAGAISCAAGRGAGAAAAHGRAPAEPAH